MGDKVEFKRKQDELHNGYVKTGHVRSLKDPRSWVFAWRLEAGEYLRETKKRWINKFHVDRPWDECKVNQAR